MHPFKLVAISLAFILLFKVIFLYFKSLEVINQQYIYGTLEPLFFFDLSKFTSSHTCPPKPAEDQGVEGGVSREIYLFCQGELTPETTLRGWRSLP